MNVADFVVVLVDQQERGFGTATIDSEIPHLPRPTGRSTRFAEFVLEIGNSLFCQISIFASVFEILLRHCQISCQTILSIVQIAVLQHIGIDLFYSQVQKLDACVSTLGIILGYKQRIPSGNVR